MLSFRVIVIVNDERANQLIVPLEHVPQPGDVIALPHGNAVTVRHVISATHEDLAGIILAWAGQ